jgi:serine/threonine protein kinase
VLNDTDAEERQTLGFLAKCGQPNLIRLLFWYKYDDKINYVFPRYPGSLQQVLEGKMHPDRAQPPAKYIGSKLRHWLWQGMVDMLTALKFFHSPEDPGLGLGPLIAAHFDLKPANVLVDDDGTLVVTDFGQARIKQLRSGGGTLLTAQAGDLNYQPPPLGFPVQGAEAGPYTVDEPSWSRAYDVWSTACIMTEVIEYITNGGADGFKSFRDSRRMEHDSSIAFWKVNSQGTYELRQCVRTTLERFRSHGDRYLNTVTDLLEVMFSIRPIDRKPIADCLAVISSDVPTDDWPLLDIDEVSISGLGTNPQLRNMLVPTFKPERKKGPLNRVDDVANCFSQGYAV